MNAEDLNKGLCESFKLLAQSIHAHNIALVRVRFQTPEEFTINDELAVVKGKTGWVFLNLQFKRKYTYHPPDPPWFCTLQEGNIYGGPVELLSHNWQPLVRRFSLASFLLFPITVDRIVWGVLSIGSTTPRYEWNAQEQGAIKLYCNTLGNILVRRKGEDKLKEQRDFLQEKLRELDEKNRQLIAYIDSNMQLENFAYIASHDIREPLRTMQTFAQLLESRYLDKLEEAGRDYVKSIIGAAKNMNQMIEDLLIYSRVEFEENEMEPIDMDQMLDEILQSLKEIIESRQAQVTWGNLPHLIKGNVSRLKQLFQNLIINAIKFGPPEGIPIVNIQCKSVNRFCQFSITDNGIGISSEFYDKIFLIFKKLHGKGHYEGTGIGLALCKKIVEQHGGKIWVESAPGVGSTFYFTLPH